MPRYFTRIFAPLAALSLALTGCDMDININGKDGVPLADLDTSGDAPTGVALFGPDTIVVTEGEKLTISTEGDEKAVEALRFVLEDGTLAVMRDEDAGKNIGTATVRVTLPALEDINMMGSGVVDAASMAGKLDINSAGSGKITVAKLTAETLDLNVLGSGSITASGTVERLDLNVAGSGSADLAGVKVDKADINVAGSGGASFASDGTVDANILGSGDVTVTGSATCEGNSVGAGKLRCNAAQAEAEPAE